MTRNATWLLTVALAVTALAWPLRQAEAAGKTGRYNVMLQGCTLPDGNQEAFDQADAAREIAVAADGQATLQCRGQIPDSLGYERPKQSLKLDSTNTGAACGTPYGSTLDWQATVAPNGRVTLTCKIKIF